MRLKSCKHCGNTFETDKRGAYLCPACALAAKQSSVYRERNCIDCKTTFMGYPKSKRCPDCQAQIDRERDRAHKRNGPARNLGSIDICQYCGKEYIVQGSLQKYCKDCGPKQTAQNIKTHKRLYMAKISDKTAPQKAANRSYNKVCLVCGKVFDADTTMVTCSPECAKKLKSFRMAETDFRRGKRKSLPKLEKEELS